VGDANTLVEDFCAGVGVGFEAFALGEGIGDGSGVAIGLGFELAARVEPGPGLPVRFELPGLRADGKADRAAAFLFTDAGEAPR
jgi:hypothetical protein